MRFLGRGGGDMKVRRGTMAGLVIALLFMASSASFAAETKFQIQTPDTIQNILDREVGQRVTLKLLCGEEMSGTVNKVGEWVVHLSELSGREFYDVAIRLDQISAVIVRVREK
jgi:hypothetical protein